MRKAQDKLADFCRVIARNRSIRYLKVDWGCDVDISILSPFIENNNHLRGLDLSNVCVECPCDEYPCDCPHNEREKDKLQDMALALSRRHNKNSLRSICLQDNTSFSGCTDELASELVRSLNGYHNLNKLNLNNNQIGKCGCTALGVLLKHPSCKLKEVYLHRCGIDNECVTILANSLVGNSCLTKLVLKENDIGLAGWKAFSPILCDTSSIETTYNSNHTLEDFGKSYISSRLVLPEEVASLMRWNESQCKFMVVRRKIIEHHFMSTEDNFDIFLDMELQVLPYVISWMGRDTSMLLYQLFQKIPTLFEANTKVGSSTMKRKRGS